MENNVFDFDAMMDNVLNGLDCQTDPWVIVDRTRRRNENLKNKTVLLGTSLVENYENRVEQIRREKVANHKKRLEANREKEERIERRQENMKIEQRCRKLDIMRSIETKGNKSKKLLAERDRLRLSEKREKEIGRYLNMVERQNMTFAHNESLLDRCIITAGHGDSGDNDGSVTSYNEEVEDEPVEEMQEEECFSDSDRSKLEELYKREDVGTLRVYLERIANLKKNFGSCEAGIYFLKKTAPLWDSLTQCIYRKSEILEEMAKNSEDTIPEGYRKFYEKTTAGGQTGTKRVRRMHAVDTSFLEELMTDLNYELSDEDVYHAMIKARRLVDSSATALELIELVKYILKYEIDVKENVAYVFNGMCRRAVFEYTKRRISYHMLGHSKNDIDRLQFLNNAGVIPRKLLVTKNNERQVEPKILELLENNDKYGRGNTVPENEMYPRRAETKMLEFLQTGFGDFNESRWGVISDADSKERIVRIYEMPGKKLLENHSDRQVRRLMVFVHKHLASSLSGRSRQYNGGDGDAELTHDRYNILARKIAKMVFGMGGPYEEKIYVLEVVMNKLVVEIAKRSPNVLYKHKHKHNATAGECKKFDIVSFSNQFDDLRTPRKSNKKK